MPIARAIQLALGHRHLAGHDARALEVGDVEALHPPRNLGEVQPVAEPVQHRLQLVPAPPLVQQRLPGVRRAHLHQPELLPTLGHEHPDPPPALLGQQLGQRLHPTLGPQGEQHLVGEDVVLAVVEVHEAAHELLVGELLPGEGEALSAVEPALADVQDVDHQPVCLAVVAEDVLVDGLGGGDLLPLQRALDGKELIAKPRGLLEPQVLRRGLHPRP
jgi:hypothetical protein